MGFGDLVAGEFKAIPVKWRRKWVPIRLRSETRRKMGSSFRDDKTKESSFPWFQVGEDVITFID